MQHVFDKLRELQDILAKKFVVLEEIKEIPRALETKEELLNRGKRSYIEKHERLDKTVEEVKELRAALDQAESDRENSEKMMEQISTQREFEALEKEINEAAGREQSLRKSLLAKEKFLGELQEQIDEQEQLMEIQEEEVKSETEKKDALLAEKEKEIKDLEKSENKLTPGIDESILFKFERIIKNKSGIGIVAVHDNVCQGCRMTLPTQFVNEVRTGEEFKFCPYCSRVLFFEDQDAEGAEAIAEIGEIEEAGLADMISADEFEDFL